MQRTWAPSSESVWARTVAVSRVSCVGAWVLESDSLGFFFVPLTLRPAGLL